MPCPSEARILHACHFQHSTWLFSVAGPERAGGPRRKARKGDQATAQPGGLGVPRRKRLLLLNQDALVW